MLRFDKAIYLSLLFKSILSVRLINNMCGSNVLLFLEFINIVFIFVLNLYWIHYIVIYILVISFARYKEYVTWRISISKLYEVLPAFTRPSAIDNLWSICLGLNILISFPWANFNGNSPVLKALKTNSLTW